MSKTIPLTHDTDTYESGLIAHYKFEGNGNDSSGQGNNLTDKDGGLTYSTGSSSDPIAYWANTTSAANANWALSTDLNQNVPITFACWFKMDATWTSSSTIFGYGDNYNSVGMNIDLNGSSGVLNSHIALPTTWNTISISGISTDVWYHYTLTITSSNLATCYINGVSSGTVQGSSAFNSSSMGYVHIGNAGDRTRGFPGSIGDFRVYNTVLTAENITKLYIYSQANSPSGTVNVTLPKYDWDFRVATPSNNILKDTINGIDASYNFGATSTVSDGAILDGTNDSIGLGIIDLSGSAQDYSYEMYFYVDSYTNVDALFNFCNSSTGAWDGDNGINCFLNANSGDPYYRITDDYYRGDGRGTSGWQPSFIMSIGSLVHLVMTVSNNNTGTGTAKLYQNLTVSSDRSWTRANGPYYNHNYICGGGTQYTGNELQMKLKYFRVYDYELSADQVSVLYSNASSISPFSFANLRINYGDVYLGQNLVKTLDDYKAENISLHDISYTAFPANKLKETYIQGPVDISGDLVVRSNKNTFYDISASKIGFSSGYDYITVTDTSYAVFASTTSSYTNTNIADPLNVGNYSGHRYGRSVDMSRDGNYIIAGVLNEGRAYVWKVDDMTVTQLGDRLVPNTGTGRFGTVRISGDGSKAVVCNHNTTGNPNQFTYTWSNPGSTTGSWTEITNARVTNSSYTEGWRVSMSQDGNVFIKSPSGTDNPISTYIWSTDQWVSPGNIAARASGTYLLDNAINYDGTICVVGGHKYDSNKGYIAAYKYSKTTTETDGTWEILGDYIDITETDGTTLLYWGEDVCINDAGDIMAAVALGDGTNVTYDLIKAYKYSTPGVLGGTWTQLGDDIKPTPGISSGGTSFQNMDMNSDGSIIAYGNDVAGTNDGAVFVYQYSLDPQIAGGTWSQIAFINRPTTSSNLTSWNFGSSVRLNGFGNKLHVGISPGGTAGVGYTYLINIGHTVDYRTTTTTVNPKIVTNDLSLNNRFFIGGDASFNGNVTIQGDLSFDSTISLSNTIANSAVNVGDTSIKTFTHDISLNADLAIHGKTTVKNDLYLNAYTDVSANPVLSDGTYLKNMKMDKLNHRYIMDISRSAPFSTLTTKTLPTNIWDSSSNSGICVSADGKHIRTVNSGDLSSNALSYYSEDYGSSFHEDEELSQKLSQFDVSINSLDDYDATIVLGQSYTNEPVGTTGLWTSGGTTSASNTVSSGTYSIVSNSVLDGQSGTMYDIWRLFGITTSSSAAEGHAMNRTGWNTSVGTNLWRHSSTSLTAYDANNSATTYNGDYITVTTPYSFQMTQIGFANHWAGNVVNKFMIIGEDSTGTNRVLLTETTHNGSVGSFITFTVSTTYMVNKFYLHITEINSSNKFTGIRKLRWNGTTPNTSTQELRPKFGSDKSFMSYNGQHQLVPKGVSNKLTYDDYLYVSNNFGKNWNLRKSSTLRTFNYTVTANGSSNYILNGETYTNAAQPTVNIGPNESVIFTVDTTTNGSHPFKIGTSSEGGEITDSTITSVTSGSNQVITFTPTTSGTFYYYCSAHSGMGNSITVANYNMGPFSPSSWFWNTGAVSADGKHMYVSGSSGFWKSSDYGRVWNQTSADSSFNFMSISADGKLVYGVNERKVYGSTDYGNTFSTLYTDAYTSDSSYCGISTSGNGKYITLADGRSSDLYLSTDYGNSFTLHTPSESGTLSLNCGISHSGKIILNSNYISFDYGNNFTYVPNLISNNLSNRDTFYSKANMEYILDPSNNALLQIPYKSAIFQDIYSVGSIKAGSTTYSSDYRLKENIQPLTDNETVNELHPVKYYNTNLKKNDYGLLAHELQEKYPFLVSGEKDGAEKQSINYNGLISLLVHEVKNLKKEYQELVEMKNNA